MLLHVPFYRIPWKWLGYRIDRMGSSRAKPVAMREMMLRRGEWWRRIIVGQSVSLVYVPSHKAHTPLGRNSLYCRRSFPRGVGSIWCFLLLEMSIHVDDSPCRRPSSSSVVGKTQDDQKNIRMTSQYSWRIPLSRTFTYILSGPSSLFHQIQCWMDHKVILSRNSIGVSGSTSLVEYLCFEKDLVPTYNQEEKHLVGSHVVAVL